MRTHFADNGQIMRTFYADNPISLLEKKNIAVVSDIR